MPCHSVSGLNLNKDDALHNRIKLKVFKRKPWQLQGAAEDVWLSKVLSTGTSLC